MDGVLSIGDRSFQVSFLNGRLFAGPSGGLREVSWFVDFDRDTIQVATGDSAADGCSRLGAAYAHIIDRIGGATLACDVSFSAAHHRRTQRNRLRRPFD